MNEQIQSILQKFPFLTYGNMSGVEYLGIIQNCDTQLLSMYVVSEIQSEELRQVFLTLGQEWWWGTNRENIPINIYFKESFRPFRDCLRHFNRKEFTIEGGFSGISLQETMAKRIRKRQITMVIPDSQL